MNNYSFGIADNIADFAQDVGKGVHNFISDLRGLPRKDFSHLKTSEDQRNQFKEEHPNLALTAGIAGALANPAGVGVGRWMGQAKNLPSLMKRGSVGGAGLSGTQAVGEAEGPLSERLQAGVGPAVGGAVVGGVSPAIIKGVGGLVRGGMNQVSRLSPYLQDKLSSRKMVEALQRDGFTVKTAEAQLKDLGPKATLADLGENTRKLMYAVYAKPGDGSGTVKKFFETRQRGDFGGDDLLQGGQSDRIHKWLENKFPSKYEGKQNAKVAGQLYKSAYGKNQSIQSDELDLILRTPDGKKAFRKAVEMMQNSREFVGKQDPELTALLKEVEGVSTGVGVSSGLKLKTYDYVKRAMQQEYNKLVRQGSTDEARILQGTLKKLTSELDSIDQGTTGGAYAKARSLTSDDFSNKDALDAGQKFMFKNMRSSDIAESLASMSPAEQHHFRIGAIDSLTEKLSNTISGANSTKTTLDVASLQRKIKAIFGDDETFGQYMKMLRNEKEMFDTYSMMGGSQTAKNLSALDDSMVDPNLILQGVNTTFKGGNPVGGGVQIVKGLFDNVKPDYGLSKGLAKLLTERNTKPLRQYFKPPKFGNSLASQLVMRGQSGTVE